MKRYILFLLCSPSSSLLPPSAPLPSDGAKIFSAVTNNFLFYIYFVFLFLKKREMIWRRKTKTHFYDKVSSAFSSSFGGEGGEFIFTFVNRRSNGKRGKVNCEEISTRGRNQFYKSRTEAERLRREWEIHCRNLLCRRLIGFFSFDSLGNLMKTGKKNAPTNSPETVSSSDVNQFTNLTYLRNCALTKSFILSFFFCINSFYSNFSFTRLLPPEYSLLVQCRHLNLIRGFRSIAIIR